MKNYLLVVVALFLLTVISCNTKSDNGKTDTSSRVTQTKSECDSILEVYYKAYITRKDSIIEKRYGKQVLKIDTAVGNAYIDAYRRELGKDRTEGVILDIQTIAFLYKYLLTHPNDSIGLSLGRYNKKYFTIGRNITDPYFDTRISGVNLNRLALVIGAYNKGFMHFDDPSGGIFYDDWNQEWP